MQHLEAINQFQIILASKSPRRQELLSNMGLKFTVHQSNVNEDIPEGVPFEKLAEHFAKYKAEDVAQYYTMYNTIVIGCDTTVLLDDELLEKPQNKAEAFEMIKQLSEKTHRVISAICIVSANKTMVYSDVSKVSFVKLRDEEINFYIDNYAPFDKAGSYGIQEWIGCIGINRIEGSFYTVVGLPTHLLWDMLKQLAIG